MRLLLDSHTLFWAISEDRKLSGEARRLILAADTDVFFSPVNLYEITFKEIRLTASPALGSSAQPR